MTATAAPAATRKWWQGMPWYSWAFPVGVGVLVLLLAVGWARKDAAPSAEELAATQAEAAKAGGQQGAASALQALGIGTTQETAPPAAPSPHYDYITCTHQRPEEKPPCEPLVVWPLTEGAKTFIGYEDGGIPGELSTHQTRLVATQIRDLGTGVDPCSLWLDSKVDEGGNFTLTVYTSQDKAPSGAAKLFACEGTGKGTQGTIPTQGTS